MVSPKLRWECFLICWDPPCPGSCDSFLFCSFRAQSLFSVSLLLLASDLQQGELCWSVQCSENDKLAKNWQLSPHTNWGPWAEQNPCCNAKRAVHKRKAVVQTAKQAYHTNDVEGKADLFKFTSSGWKEYVFVWHLELVFHNFWHLNAVARLGFPICFTELTTLCIKTYSHSLYTIHTVHCTNKLFLPT